MIHSNLTLVTAPDDFPVTLEVAKSHERIGIEADDSLIEFFIDTATRTIEGLANRQFVTATYEYCLDEFPWWEIRLPVPPCQSVNSIKFIDGNGTLQTLDDSKYVVDTRSEPARIIPVGSWPSTKCTLNAVVINFDAGYGSAENVPSTYRRAIKELVGHFYENREATSVENLKEIPLGIKNLLAVEGWGGYF